MCLFIADIKIQYTQSKHDINDFKFVKFTESSNTKQLIMQLQGEIVM